MDSLGKTAEGVNDGGSDSGSGTMSKQRGVVTRFSSAMANDDDDDDDEGGWKDSFDDDDDETE